MGLLENLEVTVTLLHFPIFVLSCILISMLPDFKNEVCFLPASCDTSILDLTHLTVGDNSNCRLPNVTVQAMNCSTDYYITSHFVDCQVDVPIYGLNYIVNIYKKSLVSLVLAIVFTLIIMIITISKCFDRCEGCSRNKYVTGAWFICILIILACFIINLPTVVTLNDYVNSDGILVRDATYYDPETQRIEPLYLNANCGNISGTQPKAIGMSRVSPEILTYSVVNLCLELVLLLPFVIYGLGIKFCPGDRHYSSFE